MAIAIKQGVKLLSERKNNAPAEQNVAHPTAPGAAAILPPALCGRKMRSKMVVADN